MVGLLGGQPRQVRSLLPISGIIIVIDPVTQGPSVCRTLPDDDDAVAIHVGFKVGGRDDYVAQVVSQADVAKGDDRERQGVELVLG